MGNTGRVQKRVEGGLEGVPGYEQVRNFSYKCKKSDRERGTRAKRTICFDIAWYTLILYDT